MRVLAVTNMYPTREDPVSGIFVEQQVKGLRDIGVDVSLMFVKRAQKGVAAYLRVQREVRDKARNYRPDLVHVMYGGVMADQVTRTITDRPTIVTFHGSDLLGEQVSGVIRRLCAAYGVWASSRAAQRASGIVVVSSVVQAALPKGVERSKARIIPCGIDLERFKPLSQNICRERLGWKDSGFHVLFPGSNNLLKRPALAKSAVETLRRLGTHAHMHCLGGVPNEEVPLWLNASDVVLLTSLHEGSPTIIKEALACNMPVVSVDVGDVRERIQGIDGCYIASPEANDLAAKLSSVCSGIRRVASRHKIQELSLERIALRLLEFYSQTIMSFTPAIDTLSSQ